MRGLCPNLPERLRGCTLRPTLTALTTETLRSVLRPIRLRAGERDPLP